MKELKSTNSAQHSSLLRIKQYLLPLKSKAQKMLHTSAKDFETLFQAKTVKKIEKVSSQPKLAQRRKSWKSVIVSDFVYKTNMYMGHLRTTSVCDTMNTNQTMGLHQYMTL